MNDEPTIIIEITLHAKNNIDKPPIVKVRMENETVENKNIVYENSKRIIEKMNLNPNKVIAQAKNIYDNKNLFKNENPAETYKKIIGVIIILGKILIAIFR